MLKFPQRFPRLTFLSILFAAMLIVGCGDDDEPMDLDKNVSIQFKSTFDGEPFAFNEARTVDDHRFELNMLKFYVSNIAFVKADGSEVLFPDPILVDLGSTLDIKDTFDLLVETGNYESVRFGVGLDENTNATNADPLETSNPLSAAQNMWWGWAKAYIFLKLEGRYDQQPIGTDLWDQSFAYHLGNDEIYKEVTLDFVENVKSNALSTLELNIDIKKVFFNDGNPIGIDEQPTSHESYNPFVVELMDNFVGAFE